MKNMDQFMCAVVIGTLLVVVFLVTLQMSLDAMASVCVG